MDNEGRSGRSSAVLRAILDDLALMVGTESPSSDLDAIARSAQAVAHLIARRLGRSAEIIVVDGVQHVAWRTPSPSVLILAHHDTVWPLGTIDEIPYSESEGVVRGPGSFDMKLGMVQAIHALAQLRREHGTDVLEHVSLLVTGDEELGSATSRALIEAEARRCRAVLVVEAAGPGGALKVARKGVSRYRIEVVGRAAHSGLEPEKGVNATIAAAETILAVAALADLDRETTVTPTVVTSGTTPNTVPALAHIDVDVRAVTATEQHRVDEAIRLLRPSEKAAVLTVRGGINRPPMERSMSAGLADRALSAARVLGLPQPGTVAVGGASDGNLTAACGIPTLDGLGAVGGGAHAPDEHAEIAFILPRTRLLAHLVYELVNDHRSGS